MPFASSLEDGIDTSETIRHWPEKKLYVKVQGKPPGGVGSMVVIFDEDQGEEGSIYSRNIHGGPLGSENTLKNRTWLFMQLHHCIRLLGLASAAVSMADL